MSSHSLRKDRKPWRTLSWTPMTGWGGSHGARISPQAEEEVVLPSDVTCTTSPRPRQLGHSRLSSNMVKRHREKMKHSCPRKCVSPSSPGLGESQIRSASLHPWPVLLHLPSHLLLETQRQAEGKLSSQLFISSVLALIFSSL